MAILVAAGGAALGTALGVGPGAGWLAGAALGNLLFPAQGPDSRVEGPRLGDLTVTSSAYGAPIAIAYGTLRMAGNLIWSSGIATIPAQLLLPLDERTLESWRERRTQEVELPERVAVVYMDKDADYQQGSQSAKRVAEPAFRAPEKRLAPVHRNSAPL